jgi:hypothetical protein
VPSVAWWLLLLPPILASLAATLILDPPVSLAVEVAGPVVGALYLVAAAGSRARIARFAAIGAVALYLVGWAVSYATAQNDWVVLRNLAVVLTVGIAAVAFSATIAAALARARARSGADSSTLAPAVVLGLVVDELVPGRNRTRLTAVERERARLAT